MTVSRDAFGYVDAVAAIEARSALGEGYVATPVNQKDVLARNLRRMRLLLERLGDPQHTLQIVHVAGSKGKATTAAHVANILTAADARCGRFISPHLNSWRERIAIGDELISGAEFASHIADVLEAAEWLEGQYPPIGRVNAFELLLAGALDFFRYRSCSHAVVEVGLGGRFDPTNVLDTDVSVITQLELEHTAILGPTLADIAWNKAGIFKPGVIAVALESGEAATTTLERVAEETGSPLRLEARDWAWRVTDGLVTVETADQTVNGIAPAMPGRHQQRIAALAAVVTQQSKRDRQMLSQEYVRLGISRTRLPGHFEVVEAGGQRFVLDVGHTPESIEALTEALESAGIRGYRVIAGFLSDKAIGSMLSALALSTVGSIDAVTVRSPRSASLAELADARVNVATPIALHSQLADVLFPEGSQVAAPEWTVITGSTALVAEARERLGLVDRFL
ncbi:MAG: folylpolyglutamate synthase/dihydrofolate synthase family protein [Thermomicrobiales bacterium]